MTASIDLAAEADFALGKLNIRPSLREIEIGGDTETLEPRVMQVLVALARSLSQVVSRDLLVTLCWEGRAVGEDAIQRAIAKARKLGESTKAFTIETVPRVGYRLKTEGAHQSKLAVTAAPREPILAVLPFDNLSDDREMQFFSDGVSEEILQALTRTQGMKTIGRASSFQFRGVDKTVRKVAAELGATHVLDGSVRRAGDRIRVSAQLIEATTQTTTWAEQYDHELSDILRLQADVATSVTEALHAKLVHKPEPMLIDPIAFEMCARARSLASKYLSDADVVASVSLLEQAVERAPRQAEAWGLLAANKALLIPRTHDEPSSPMHEAARAAANNALALDPATPSAVRALAFLLPGFARYQERLDLAEKAVKRRRTTR
jgi:TolB-like protein